MYYSYNKYITENLIRKKLNNYTILRLPLILNELKDEPFIYNIKKNLLVEVTTNKDAAYALVKAIDYKEELNKKTYNVGLCKEGRVYYKDILNNILKYYGISMKYILERLFLDKNYLSPVLTDSDDLDNIIHYRTDTLYNYYRRLQNKGKKRIFQKAIGKIILFFNKDRGV